MGTYLFTHSVTLTMLQVLFSEYLEALFAQIGRAVGLFDDATASETWTGSLVGDGTIGFVGAALGALIAHVSDAPPLWRASYARSMWWKYLGLWGVYGAISLLHLWQSASPINPGAIAALLLQVVYVAWLLPLLTRLSALDYTLVWRARRGSGRARSVRFRLFAWWTAVLVAVYVQTVGLQYLPNDWYQVLVSVGVALLALGITALVRWAR